MPLFRSKALQEPKAEGGGGFFRRLSLTNKGTVARKLRFDSSMAEIEILEWLQQVQDNPQFSQVSFDEVLFTNDLVAKLVQVLSSLSKRTQHSRCYFDKLNLEFCQGSVDMVVTTALLMECVKHLFVATDVEEATHGGLVARLAAALRVNLSLKSLWLLVPLTLESATALGEALAVNDSLNKLSLSGSQWNLLKAADDDDEYEEGNETDTYGTDTDGEEFVDSRWASAASSDDDDDAAPATSANVQIMRYTDPQLAEKALRLPRALANGLQQNTCLRTIDLSCCSLGDDALGTILQALVGHPTLETLDVSRNRAGTESVRALAELLAHPETVLTTLDLREQRKTPKPVRVTKRKSKKRVQEEEDDEDDFDNGVGDGLDLIPISQALYNNDILQVFKLSHNRLVDDQIAELVRNLQGNETLVELDLQFNSITARGLKALTKGLSDLPALKVLLLGGNDFGKEGTKILAQLEDDDDSVCTIMENGGSGGATRRKEDDEETFHSAKSTNTSKHSSSKARVAALGGGFMGGLTGISEK